MSPSVYAVVLNHNGAGWLKRCLGSLLACSYPELRVLLVDNASTDDSLEVAGEFAGRLHILQNSVNLGFCEGNNRGISYALEHGADYVALLNNDTWFEPEWLDSLVAVGERNPQVGIVGPVQLCFDSGEFNTWTTSALPHLLDALRRPSGPEAWFPVEWVEGSCLVAKRALFEHIGKLDPLFLFFFEEIDLCRRARAAGFGVVLVPASRIHHHRGGSFAAPHLARRRSFLFLRNSLIYNSTDPEASLLTNLGRLLRCDSVHLKDAILGRVDPLCWCKANASLLSRLPSLYRKWRGDRAVVRACRRAASALPLTAPVP